MIALPGSTFYLDKSAQKRMLYQSYTDVDEGTVLKTLNPWPERVGEVSFML